MFSCRKREVTLPIIVTDWSLRRRQQCARNVRCCWRLCRNPPARRKPFTPVISRWDLNPRHALPRSILALYRERVAGLPTELLLNGDGRSRTAVRTGLLPSRAIAGRGLEPRNSVLSAQRVTVRRTTHGAPRVRGRGWFSTSPELPTSDDASPSSGVRKSAWRDSNPRHPAPKAGALPNCATHRVTPRFVHHP